MVQVMGQKFLWILVVLGNLVTISLQASTVASDSYVAAVVEYAPVSGATLQNKDEIFMQNVANYACFMEEAARQGADIIVFPEVGLASMGVPRNPDGTPSLAFYVPEPGSNPCNDNSSEIAQGLRELSCAASRNSLYVVVNLPERVNCSGCPCAGFPTTVDGEECPPAGAYFHNTNVAFDRSGTVVARYRKFNLFGEPGFVPTLEPEFATFDTDFGVNFGMFICFDIMFEKPAAALARDYGVCDFAFPTAWFSEAPFLTAVQTQAAWAYSLDVNLLASGYNKPEVGSAGSGIFLGRNGTLQWVMPNSTTSRLLVGTVPKVRRCKIGYASRTRSERAAPGGGEYEDDDNAAVERTPLSAFHHIVRQRKYGHLGTHGDESLTDEAAPAFIHHSMYDTKAEASENDDDSQPPSGEYESKVPPHFMGLHQTAEIEDNGETEHRAETGETGSEGAEDGDEPSENEVQKTVEEEENFSHGSSSFGDAQKVDSPEKKIPATTRTDAYDYSEPSQNPDLLRLYQDQDEPENNQLPEEFLEIEVPEIYERSFEPERDQEYFKLPEKEEILLPGEGKVESKELSHEEENQQLLDADDSAVALSDSAELNVPLQEEKKETEEKVVDTVKEQATNGEQETMSDEDRNTTEEEIEAGLKKFEWLMEDTNDSLPHDTPEEEQNVPPAPSAGKGEEEAPIDEHIDETDDVLGDDHGLHLVDDGGQDGAAPGEGHIDDTDDVLADDHGLSELDDGGYANTKQEAKDTEELSERSEGDTLVDNKQTTELEDESKKIHNCRKRNRRDRAQRNRQLKCKPRPEEQKSAEEPDGTIADDQPVVEAPENVHEGVDGDTKSEERKVTSTETKRPCKPRERRASGCPPFRDGVLEDERVSKSTAGLFLKRDHLEVYKTFTLNTDTLIENSTVLLCDGTFCCNFHVVLEVNATPNQPRYAYRLAVFDGVRTFDGVATGGVQVCAVIPCSRDDLDSCGMLTLPDAAANATVFRNISISGVFSTNHTLVTANTLVPGLAPLPADKFNMTSVPVADKLDRVTLKTTGAVLEQGVSLFTFAIHSRVYKRDGEPVTTPAPTAAGDDSSC